MDDKKELSGFALTNLIKILSDYTLYIGKSLESYDKDRMVVLDFSQSTLTFGVGFKNLFYSKSIILDDSFPDAKEWDILEIIFFDGKMYKPDSGFYNFSYIAFCCDCTSFQYAIESKGVVPCNR